MAKHVIEIEFFGSVVRRVNVRIRVLELGFNNKSGWVSSFVGRSVI